MPTVVAVHAGVGEGFANSLEDVLLRGVLIAAVVESELLRAFVHDLTPRSIHFEGFAVSL